MPGISCLAERLLASEEGLYSIQLVSYVGSMKKMRNAYKILVRKPRHGWEHYSKMHLQEIRHKGGEWIQLISIVSNSVM